MFRSLAFLLLFLPSSDPQTPQASPLPGQVSTPSIASGTPKNLPAAVSSQPRQFTEAELNRIFEKQEKKPAEWAALAPAPVKTTAVIVGPKQSAPGDLVILDASTSDAASFAWALPGSSKTLLPVDGGKRCVFATGAAGRYTFVLATAKGDAVAIATHELVIGKPEPPVPPVPPTPPDPPTPVDPSPFVGDGLRVLITYETQDVGKLKPGHQAAIFGKQVRELLDQKCVMGPDGKTHEWRIWDKDVAVGDESDIWKAAAKRDKKSIPWIAIGNGKSGFEGPLPDRVEDTIALINKFGG